ncbi:hypothetical protein [Ferruginibacter sp.]
MFISPLLVKSQYVGGAYYKRKLAEAEPPKTYTWKDIYVDTPLYVGMINRIKFTDIDLQQYTIEFSSFNSYKQSGNVQEYEATFTAPGTTSLICRNKLTGKTAYIYHYKIKRLPADEFKEEPVFSIENAYGNKIGLSSLKNAKKVVISNDLAFKSAQVYFSGTGFKSVWTQTLTQSSLKELDSLIALCQPGSQIIFDNIYITAKNGKAYGIEGKSYTVITDEELKKIQDNSLAEFRRLINLDFVRGTIYFSGANFSTIQQVFGKDMNTEKHKVSERCAPGSVITFDNCVYKNEKGILTVLENRSIKLQ